MLIEIDNEAARLDNMLTPEHFPFVVIIYRSVTSRSPIHVRRKTLKEAMHFVEEYTGIYAHRWVKCSPNDTSIHSFTGSHEKRYEDTAQYKPIKAI